MPRARRGRLPAVPLPGTGGHGSKPGSVEGLLAIQFIEFQTSEGSTALTPIAEAVRADLERMARPEGVGTAVLDIHLDQSAVLGDSQVAGFFGNLRGEPTGTIWYGLSLAEPA